MNKNRLRLLGLSLLLLAATKAAAAGLQVSPSKLELTVSGGEIAHRQLTIANPSADVELLEVYPDDALPGLTLNPASFTLESGDRKTVLLTFVPRSHADQKIETNISIVARPLADSRFQANSGVKVPLIITTLPAMPRPTPTTSAVVTALVLALFLLLIVWWLQWS